MKYNLFFLLGFFIIVASCKKNDNNATPDNSLTIHIVHTVDTKTLYWDSLIYTNASSELYSVSRLEYFLSNFHFYKNNTLVYQKDTVLYVNAQLLKNDCSLSNFPEGSYDSVSFLIGVDSAHNIHDSLPPTASNIGMEWPDAMGGGYHFMKFEGHWLDTNSNTPGFAMHLGTNAYLIATGAKGTFVKSNSINSITLNMNLNAWFNEPNKYSFQNDGVYTMGNATLMQKIKENGSHVFTISN